MIPQQIPSKKAIQEHKLIGKLTAPAVRFFCAGDAGMEVFCMCGIVGYVGKRLSLIHILRLAGVDAEEALTFASRRFCDACLQQEQRGIQADAPAPIEETK